jgi:hypothetical protein
MLRRLNIGELVVDLIAVPIGELEPTNFIGQKIQHPMIIERSEKTVTLQDKKKGSYTKEIVDVHYTSSYVSSEAQDAIENPKLISIKFDGSCGYLQFDNNEITMYTRLDLSFKDDKISMFGKLYDSENDLPKDMIKCENDPRGTTKYIDYGKLHWPFMLPIAKYVIEPSAGAIVQPIESIPNFSIEKTYKWNILAFENAIKSGKLFGLNKNISVEQMGKQFNMKQCDDLDTVALIPHNSVRLHIPRELCNYDGLVNILLELNVEGLVIYGNNGTVWKFRREMIKHNDMLLKWPESVDKNNIAKSVTLL